MRATFKASLVATVAFVALAAMPAQAQRIVTQGVTDTEIKIGVHLDLSGPITVWGVPQRNGHIMRVEEQNEKGGVHGRKINLIVDDNGYDPKRGVLATQKQIQQDKVFTMVGVLGTPIFIPSKEIALEAGIPFIFPGTNHRASFEPFNKLLFSMSAPYDSQIMNGVKWFVDTKAKKKVGVIYQDDDFGKDIRDAAQKQAAASKVEFVGAESYKRGDTAFSSQVTNLRRAGADFVVLGTVPRETAGVMAEMSKIGWKVDTMTNAGACSNFTVALGKEAVEGLYAQCQYVPFDPENESPVVKAWMERYEKRFNTKADVAAAITYDMQEMIMIALDRAGRDLTAEKFIAGLESIRNWQDIFGAPAQTFGPTKRGGTDGFVLTQVQGGKFKRVAVMN